MSTAKDYGANALNYLWTLEVKLLSRNKMIKLQWINWTTKFQGVEPVTQNGMFGCNIRHKSFVEGSVACADFGPLIVFLSAKGMVKW